jgi:hypothetical protein
MGVLGEGQTAVRQLQANQTRPVLPWTTDLQAQPGEVWKLLTLAQQQQVFQIITSTCCSLVSPAISSPVEGGVGNERF